MKIHGDRAGTFPPMLRAGTGPAPRAGAAPSREEYSAGGAARATSIMAGQDLTRISSNELQSLAMRLRDAGVISDEQMLDLSAPHVGR